jgi:uncharacterized protein YbaA (DUF1428 family)
VHARTDVFDGVVTAVPAAEKEAYRAFGRLMRGVFKAYGALEVVDCSGDDVPPKLTSFPLAVRRARNETVAFGRTTWPSRTARDEAWKRMMADWRMQHGANPMPFDGKRMIYGGFGKV